MTFFSFQVNAQNPEPVFKRFTVDDGLPSSMVYHVFQDSRGYMWFATSNGVSRYDGYKFENFDLQSGLVDNEVFEIYEDYKHRVWFIPISGKLSYFENNKIVSYKYNYKIKGHLPSSRGPIKCSFYVDSLDYVYLSLKQFGLISISPEGVYKRFVEEDKEINITAKELPSGQVLISNANLYPTKYIRFQGLHQNFTITPSDINVFYLTNPHHVFFLSMPDSSIICSLFQTIIKLKNGKIVCKRRYDEELLWMNLDNENNLWVAQQNGGIECFSNYDITKNPKTTYLRNVQVSSVFKDREGAFWFSTLNDGVFYCSDINFVNYTKENGLQDNRINAINVNKEGIYIGYDFGFVDILKGSTIKRFDSPNPKVRYSSVRRIIIDSLANRIWVCSIDNQYWIQNNQRVNHLGSTPNRVFVYPRVVVKSRFGGYWIGASRGLFKYNGNKVEYESDARREFTGIIFDLIEDKNGDIWFSTLNGLWKFTNGTYQYLGTDNADLAQTYYSIISNPIDTSIWLGTNGSGIVVKAKNKTYQITKSDGLVSNSIRQLFYTKDNIWVATTQGLSRITLKNSKYSIQNFTNANGLPTNEVLSVAEFNNTVYVGTSKGLTIFDKNKVTNDKSTPNVIIRNLKVNNNSIDLTSRKIELKYYQNSLNFDFVGFVFRKEGNVKYRYRMMGIDTTWVQTQTPSCLYSGLSSGKYTFEVEVQSYSGIWSHSPATVTFTIEPPFWKKTWFLITGTLLFSIVIFFIFRIRVNAINRRNDLLLNINLYKQQSLRQQMNPHFIFNTLNSIQLYILERDPISSHKYLTKFSRLMRMTLDNSLRSTIPINDEIEALRIYLDLEKLRLEGKFTYEIDCGTDKNILNYKIPTLLLQPYVENAIWHGIMLKQNQSGWVIIKLREDGEIIHCTISDNGIGRKQANKIRTSQNKEYKSRGSQITQQRIDLLNSMYHDKFNIRYEDLYNTDNQPIGTIVHISIPKGIS